MEKVRLAQANAAMYEQGIIASSRVLSNGQGCGVWHAVAAADDEGVEGIVRAELRGGGEILRSIGRFLQDRSCRQAIMGL
jgi:hypothetical protein